MRPDEREAPAANQGLSEIIRADDQDQDSAHSNYRDDLIERRKRDLPPGVTVDEDEIARSVDRELIEGFGDKPALGAFRGGPFVSWVDFWKRERVEQEWLLDRILARGRGHAIYAGQKVGKSLLLLWAAVTLATGAEPVVVVYVDFEMTEDDLFERLVDMGHGPETDLSRLRYALLPSLRPLDTAEGAAEFLDLLDQAARPDHHMVVIIDTTSRAVAGDENSADTIRAFYRHTGIALKQRGVTWARIDHAGQDISRGQRGSTAKGDDVDVIWRLERSDDGYVLKLDNARMGWVPEKVALERQDEPLRFVVGDEALPAGTKELADTLAELQVPATATVRVSRAALKAAGRTAKQTVLVAAVKYRKGRVTPDVTPSEPENVTLDVTLADSATDKGVTPRVTPGNGSGSPSGCLRLSRDVTPADLIDAFDAEVVE